MPLSQSTRLLCIGQSPDVLMDLSENLQEHYEFYTAESDKQAMAMIREQGPYDAILIDSPKKIGLLEDIRSASPSSVRILLAQEKDVDLARDAEQSGQVYSYLIQPYSTATLLSAIDSAVVDNERLLHKQQLEDETKEFLSKSDRLRSAMMFDPELGVGSPDAMEMELEYTHSIAARYKRPYSIILFDLDYYAEYSVHYGAKAARLAHKLMAEHIRHTCRAADRIYRYGVSTPVLLILPETDTAGANILSERIVSSFLARNIPNVKSELKLLSLSSSLAGYDSAHSEQFGNWQAMLDQVSLYLQVAQGQGGNCVMSFDTKAEELG